MINSFNTIKSELSTRSGARTQRWLICGIASRNVALYLCCLLATTNVPT